MVKKAKKAFLVCLIVACAGLTACFDYSLPAGQDGDAATDGDIDSGGAGGASPGLSGAAGVSEEICSF